jgi:hypothetical protein
MRAFVVDWLAELHFKFKMCPETLHVAIGLMDNYLNVTHNIIKNDL